jgi:hypothetical protein
MPDIPHQLVPRRVKDIVERNRQLDNAKSGSNVPARSGAHIDETRANLVGEHAKFVARPRAHVSRRRNLVQNAHNECPTSVA